MPMQYQIICQQRKSLKLAVLDTERSSIMANKKLSLSELIDRTMDKDHGLEAFFGKNRLVIREVKTKRIMFGPKTWNDLEAFDFCDICLIPLRITGNYTLPARRLNNG
jgi:hypothetical protein